MVAIELNVKKVGGPVKKAAAVDGVARLFFGYKDVLRAPVVLPVDVR